ncbi:hypothetical protein [Burkholderia pseudomallei]|uniref:hypothetical protein n=1 Tax=Burkholderia pseudomallei TaxID=28450 RepID=UPI00052A1FDD|nr:hypothetical protein [Burkholderia pseudomallei]AIV88501.1 hypothetical protein X995_5189 [Burkholderia pseudomallei B03]AIV94114.1 hypothetical protein X996_5899 [Burkholderia pseudomallei A79A]KGX96470.1 hypothetical protein Y023_5064 [Burkholderia pseudomallei A79D]
MSEKLKIGKDERVITAFAEPAAGPGWRNQPIWVIIRDGNGQLRQECIQPEQQTYEMLLLYRASYELHSSMTMAANDALSPPKVKLPRSKR